MQHRWVNKPLLIRLVLIIFINNKILIERMFFFVVVVVLVLVFCFAVSWATPVVYGGSQAKGQIGAAATSLRQSHSNKGFQPHLQPTPQLMATLDP